MKQTIMVFNFFRKFSFLGVLLLVVALLPESVLASSQMESFSGGAGFEVARDPRAIASLLVNSVLAGLGLVMISYIIWGGYLVMTGGGQDERITRGKRAIWTSTAGAIIILLSYGISRYVILIADYAANDQPNIYNSDAGFSVDINTTRNNNIPNDPYFDPDPSGTENALVDPDFYR